MKYTKKGLLLSQVDIEVLKDEKYAELRRRINGSEFSASNPVPIITPELLPLFVFPDCGGIDQFRVLCRRMYGCAIFSDRHYHREKLDGRIIYVPLYDIRKYQRWIYRNILSRMEADVSPHAIAYRPGKRLPDSMRPHVGKRCLVKLDIRHFFDSVKFMDVYRIFEKTGYPKNVVTLLTNLCCLKGRLPVGAPTSPMLANLVLRDVDDAISEYCRTHGEITYTRYSDDMIFSGDDFEIKPLIAFVSELLRRRGFELNREKARVIGRGARQMALGLVLNEKLAVTRDYRRKIRQTVYLVDKYGVNDYLLQTGDPKFLYNGDPLSIEFLRSLIGKINWVLAVDPENEEFLSYKKKMSAKLYVLRTLEEEDEWSDGDIDMEELLSPEAVGEVMRELGFLQ